MYLPYICIPPLLTWTDLVLPGKQKCVFLLLIRCILADLELAQSSLLGVPATPHALHHILTDTITFKAIEVSANLHNKVSKGEGCLSTP